MGYMDQTDIFFRSAQALSNLKEQDLKTLDRLVEAGNTVVAIEHEMRVAAVSDWILDIGPGAGEAGGKLIAAGPPQELLKNRMSRTAPYLARLWAEAR